MDYNKEYAKKVYAGLKKRGYTDADLGDEELFVTRMGREENRRYLYDLVTERGDANIGSWERFNTRMTEQPTVEPDGVIQYLENLSGIPYPQKEVDKSQYTGTELGIEPKPAITGKGVRGLDLSDVERPYTQKREYGQTFDEAVENVEKFHRMRYGDGGTLVAPGVYKDGDVYRTAGGTAKKLTNANYKAYKAQVESDITDMMALYEQIGATPYGRLDTSEWGRYVDAMTLGSEGRSRGKRRLQEWRNRAGVQTFFLEGKELPREITVPKPKGYSAALRLLPILSLPEEEGKKILGEEGYNALKFFKAQNERFAQFNNEAEEDAARLTPIETFYQSAESMGRGVEGFTGEALNLFSGSSLDDKAIIDNWDYFMKLRKQVEKDPGSAIPEKDVDKFEYISELVKETGSIEAAKAEIKKRSEDVSVGDRLRMDASDAIDSFNPTAEGFGGFVAEMAPQMIGVIGSLIAGGAGAPLLAAGIGYANMGYLIVSEMGHAMKEARDAGATNLEVWSTGIANGAVELITEKLPFDYLTRGILRTGKGKIAKELVEQMAENPAAREEMEELLIRAGKEMNEPLLSGRNIKKYVANVAAEGASEFTAEALQTMTTMIYENPEDYPTLTEILKNGVEGLKGGLFMGAVNAGIANPMERRANDERRKRQGYVQVARVEVDGNSYIGEILGEKESGELVVLVAGKEKTVTKDNIKDIVVFEYNDFHNGVLEGEINAAYEEAFNEEPSGAAASSSARGLNDAENAARVALGVANGVTIEEYMDGKTIEQVAMGDDSVREALENYFKAKADFDGRRQRFQETLQKAYEASDKAIDVHINKRNPAMVYSTMYDGQQVYITDGDVVLNEDGTIDYNNSSEALYITYPDGHVEQVSANKIIGKITAGNTEELKAQARAQIDQNWKNEFEAAEVQAVEQEKRDNGVVFNMTDALGEHRIEIVSKGEKMSEILLDGEQVQIPTKELNSWKQEAGIQTESAVVDNTTANGVPAELPNIPDFFRLGGKNYSIASRNADGSMDVMVDGKRETLPAGTDYSTFMPTDKKGNIIFTSMPVERTHEYFVQKVKDDEARAVMIEKRRKNAEAERKKFDKKPDPGIDPDAYEAKMTQWEADKKAAQAKVDYWNEVAKREAEITRSETREAVENIKPDVVEETADEFIANHLPKITPESFKRETGLSNTEQAQALGVISNNGVSVERAAEIILENYDSELRGLGFTGDVQDVRDTIISILSQGNPRGYAKRGREAREAENMDQQRAEAEAWARGAFDMTLDELYLYEETLLPRIMRDYEGFDENEYYSNLAENNGNDTTRESESIGRGSEVLQGEQPVPAGGAPVVGQRNEGGAVSDDVQGRGQNGVAQEEVPVNEPVGNSEQLSSSEIPNNQSVAEGSAPGNGGVAKAELQDALAFAEAYSLNTVEAYQAYLDRFPEGAYRDGARNGIWTLEGTEEANSEAIERAMDVIAQAPSGVYADNQGNPVDADGKLIVDEVNSIDEITDEDFETPTRNVQLPTIPENVANAIGSNGRPVVIKKNVFEKNGNTHVELEPEDSRNILRSALYNPNLVGSTQPIKRPDYKVAIRTGEQNAVVVLDVYQEKDFVEIVGWRMVNEKGLAKMQRQAEREGGQFLILSPNDGSAAALSALPLGLSSASEDMNSVANSQENAQKSGENAENAGEIQEPSYVEETLDNGDKRITSYNSRGEVATVAIERDGKVVSVDSYDEGVLFEHAEYDDKGRASLVTRYDKLGNVIGTQKYVNGIESKAFVKETMRTAPLRKRAEEWVKDTGVPVRLIGIGDEITNSAARRAINAGEKVTGWIDNNEVVLYLPNISNEKEIDDTFVHEVVAHKGLKALMGDKFDALCDKVWEMMSEEQRAHYLDYPGVNGDTRKAADEYMAHLAEGVDLTEQDKTVWQRIVEAVREFLVKHGMKMTDGDIENLIRASYSRLRAQSTEYREQSKDAQFRIAEVNERFNNELQQQIDGTLPKGHIYELGMPSEVLKSAGLPNLPIELAASRLSDKSMQENHPFELSEIKGLVEAVQEPLAVFRSATRLGSFVVLTEIQHEGRNYVVAIETNRKRGKIEINSVRSVYPKNNTQVANWIEEGLLEYADKKRMSEWFSKQRSNSADVRNLFRHSAKLVESFENPSIESENTLFRTTYHGSGAKFDRFDHSFMGTGEGAQAFGWGTYVTEVEGIGRQYAESAVDISNKERNIKQIRQAFKKHPLGMLDVNTANLAKTRLDYVENKYKGSEQWNEVQPQIEELRELVNRWEVLENSSRNLYTVEIPDDNGSNYLHWEEVVPKKVENAVKERLFERLSEGQGEAYKSDLKRELNDVFRFSDYTGRSLYHNLSAYVGGDKAASLFLNDLGFVGISYPANATTGGRADGARNYVIFNENDAKIEDRTQFRIKDDAQNRKDSERRKEKVRLNNAIDTAAGFILGSKELAKKRRLKREAARKQFAKEMYSSVLKGDFNDVTLAQIDKFIEDATPANPFGRRISQRLPQRMERGLRQGARTNAVDALFSRICESTVPANERFSEAGRREIEERKKELLKGWAIATGNWHTDLKEFTDDTEPIGEGKDSKVYMSKDGNSVIKASKGKPFGKKFRPDIDNIPLFNDVFKNSRYEILGYGEIDGRFVRILKQDFIDFAESTPLTPEERKEYMGKLGFKPLNKDYTAFSNGEIVIADLQKGNVVKDAAGNISVIDADAKLHTKDVGGDYTYPPVEEDLPEDGGTRFRIANEKQDIFVSNAQRAVEGIQQNKATAEQWIAMLKKNGGLKAGEEAWLGLEEWLAERGKMKGENGKVEPVTKQEVLDFIGENVIRIEEVEYGSQQYPELEEMANSLRKEYEALISEGMTPDGAWYSMEEKYDRINDAFYMHSFDSIVDVDAAMDMYFDIYGENLEDSGRAVNSTRLNYTTEGLENKREIALVVPTVEPYNASDEVHFGDAGGGRAVAWVRFGETTDSEGNRVLVIDEIQSKRHQDGREKGYKDTKLAELDRKINNNTRSTEAELEELGRLSKERYDYIINKIGDEAVALDNELTELQQKAKELGTGIRNEEAEKQQIANLELELEGVRNVRDYDRITAEIEEIEERMAQRRTDFDSVSLRMREVNGRIDELINNYVKSQRGAVEDAPFEKNWHELAMKRMLRLAAEEGFDKVAWTTGEQQAQRYNLSQMVGGIEVRRDNGERHVITYDPQGNPIWDATGVMTSEEITETFGKELGGKILAVESGKRETITGDNLRIGGEGMKGFYDRMLPSFVSKYTKKWGASVGTVEMPGLEENNVMHSVDVTPEMQESVMQGQTMFRIKEKSPETALPEDETSFKGTAISGDDGAKILNNIDNAIKEYENKGQDTKTFIGDVANALGVDAKDRSSKYATFKTKNGKIVTIRISDHNATVSNFDNNGEEDGISVVISRKPNEGVTNDGNAHVTEFFYSDKKLKTADGKPLVEILKSIKQALYSGEYKDNTGLAEVQEVNDDIRFRIFGGNSGYVGYSMSKRAAEARKEGRYPKTDFKKVYGVSGKSFDLLQKAGIIYNSEWHHTSKFGNRTDFYSWDEPEFAEYYAANKKRIDKAINDVEKLKPEYDEWKAIDKYLSEGRSQSEIRDLVDEDLRRIEPAEKAYNDARSRLIGQLKDEFYDNAEGDETMFRMGSRVDARMAEVAAHFDSKELTAEQQAVVDVFGGKADNLTISVKTKDGNERRVVMRQGNEMGAGAKHSLFRHFGMNNGAITAEDITTIPDVIAFGERTENKRGNTRLAVYRLTDDNGTRFTVVTEVKEKGEVFNDFYTNKKALNQTPQMPNGDTQSSARTNDLNASEDKGSNNSSNSQGGGTLFRTAEEVIEQQGVNESELAKNTAVALGEMLNTPVSVIEDSSTLPENRRDKKGWFDPKTGEVAVVMGNHISTEDVVETVLHEVVGHKGLRAVMGEKFDEFLDGVYRNGSSRVKRGITDVFYGAIKGGHALTVREATEEYVAGLAERDFEGFKDTWNAIKQWFRDFFRNFMNMEVTDGELRYMLWKNYNRMKSGPIETIIDRAMEARTDTGDKGTMFRRASTGGIGERYDRRVEGKWNKVKEGWYDATRSMKVAQEEIERESGKSISDSANIYDYANHVPSINRNKMERFDVNYIQPFLKFLKAVRKIKLASGEKLNETVLGRYANAKHGIERNREMSVREALTEVVDGKPQFNKNAYEQYKIERDAIRKNGKKWLEQQNELDELAGKYGATIRDYSGLTAIFDPEQKLKYSDIRKAAVDMVLEVEGKIDSKKFWEHIKGINGYSLKENYESGLMSLEDYKNVSGMYEYYVPLRGHKDIMAEDVYDYVEEKKSNLNGVVITTHGRITEANDIFATMLNMANSAIVFGSKNRMKQHLLNLCLMNQTPLLTLKSAWYQKEGGKYVPKYPNITEGMTAEQINAEHERFEQEMAGLAEMGLAVRHRQGLNLEYNQKKDWEKNQHAVPVKRNGREYIIYVNGSPRLAQAVNGLLLEDDGNWFLNSIDRVNRWRAKAVTGYSPSFVLRNLSRDMQSASIVYYAMHGATQMRKFDATAIMLIPQIHKLYKLYKKGALNEENETHRYFKEFLENGGETGYTEMISIEEFQRKVKKYARGASIGDFGKKPFKAMADAAEFANRGVENVFRFAAYMTSRKAGMSILKSINDAKEVSVNFNRKGSGAYGQAEAKRLYMFLNPAIQAMVQRIELTKKYPKRMAKVWATEFAMGAAMPALWTLIYALCGGDEDEAWGNYYNKSNFSRRSNITLPLGDGTINIPLAHESRTLYGLGEMLTSWMMGHTEYDVFGEELFNTLTQSLPLNPIEGWAPGDNIGETLKFNLYPDALKPFIEIGYNRDFAGNRIHNASDFNAHYPERERGKRGASSVFTFISELISGEYERNWVDDTFGEIITPSSLEHLAKSNLGGLYDLASELGKTAQWIAGDEEFAEFKNVPIINSFYSSLEKYESKPTEERTRRDWEKAFKFYAEEISGDYGTEKNHRRHIKDGDEEATPGYNAMIERGETLRIDIFNDGKEVLKELYDELNAARAAKNLKAVEDVDRRIYAQKRKMVEQMEQMGDDPMSGYLMLRGKTKGIYGEHETYGDYWDMNVINDFQTELKPLYEEYKGKRVDSDKQKVKDLWWYLEDIEDDISYTKKRMTPENADEKMAKIRELRAKAIKRINNYRKDE